MCVYIYIYIHTHVYTLTFSLSLYTHTHTHTHTQQGVTKIDFKSNLTGCKAHIPATTLCFNLET